MAELPHLGKHCHVEHCKQLDFLPFTCSFCKQIFCSDHRTTENHGCPAVENHMLSADEAGEARSNLLRSCNFTGCNQKELIPVVCNLCEQNFCLQHRHPPDHQCPKAPTIPDHMPLTNSLVTSILESKKDKPVTAGGKGRKSATTAAKVQLMKLKQKAVGDKKIPMEERVYFEVHLPRSHKTNKCAFFFSKFWSVGRATDSIADLEKLLNENNKTTKNKLQLFQASTRNALKMEDTLEHLIQESNLASGDLLILEYVPRECNSLSSEYEVNL